MRLLVLAATIAGLQFAASLPAAAQKKNPWCDQNICVKYCVDRGGKAGGCPQYCDKRIREDKRCK